MDRVPNRLPNRLPRWGMLLAFSLIVALVVPGAPGLAQDSAGDDAAAAAAPFTVGEPVVFRNLAIFPLLAPEGTASTEYLTLDEGVEDGLVTVEELGGGGTNGNSNEPQMQSNNMAPQATEPRVQEQDQEQTADADAYARLRQMVAGLDADADAAALDAVMLEVIRLQRERIAEARQRLMPQGRDIRPDMDRLAEEEAVLVRIAEAIRARIEGRGELPQPVEPQTLEPQVQQESNNIDPRQQAQQMQQQLRGSGASVNSLRVTNRSDKPLFLMAGELVLGGQQDRIVAVDTVVPAGQAMDIRVFCVEQGRWSGVARFGSGRAVVHGKLRQIAQDSKSQREVWDEVSRANSKLGTADGNDTGTYRHNLSHEEIAAQTAAYTGHVNEHFRPGDRVIGVAVAIRGEVHLLDRFGNPGVFRALWPKLLQSHVLAAIMEADDWKAAHPEADADAAVAAPATDAVLAFYRDATSATAQADDNGQTLVEAQKLDTERVTGFIARVTEDENEAGLLHENLYRK